MLGTLNLINLSSFSYISAQSKQSTPTNSGNYSDLINSFSVGDPSPVEVRK